MKNIGNAFIQWKQNNPEILLTLRAAGIVKNESLFAIFESIYLMVLE